MLISGVINHKWDSEKMPPIAMIQNWIHHTLLPIWKHVYKFHKWLLSGYWKSILWCVLTMNRVMIKYSHSLASVSGGCRLRRVYRHFVWRMMTMHHWATPHFKTNGPFGEAEWCKHYHAHSVVSGRVKDTCIIYKTASVCRSVRGWLWLAGC